MIELIGDCSATVASQQQLISTLQGQVAALQAGQAWAGATSSGDTITARNTYIPISPQVTVPKNGVYLVISRVRLYGFTSGQDNSWQSEIASYTTSTQYCSEFGFNVPSVADGTSVCTNVVTLVAGDVLNIRVIINGSGTSTITAPAACASLHLIQISP